MHATCGSESNSDVLVSVVLEGEGIKIDLISKNKPLFGRHIEQAVLAVCREMSIENAKIEIKDFGALDFVIRARTKTALNLAQKKVM